MTQLFEREMDAIILQALADSGLADAITYRRQNGEVISTNAEIDVNAELMGDFESGTIESRTTVTLQRADVGEPVRGDTIIDADGNNYEVQDIDEGGRDRSIVRVTVK